MSLVSEEMMKELVKGAESIGKVSSGMANDLMNEAINLFIIEGVLSILKFSVVFVIFLIVKKYLDTMAEMYKERIGMFKAFKTTALVMALVYFSVNSFPHIMSISKALVAPKIYLMEKTKEMVK